MKSPMKSLLDARFEEAGTTFETRPDGRVGVTNWPAVRSSSDTFLNDRFAEYEAERKAVAESGGPSDQAEDRDARER